MSAHAISYEELSRHGQQILLQDPHTWDRAPELWWLYTHEGTLHPKQMPYPDTMAADNPAQMMRVLTGATRMAYRIGFPVPSNVRGFGLVCESWVLSADRVGQLREWVNDCDDLTDLFQVPGAVEMRFCLIGDLHGTRVYCVHERGQDLPWTERPQDLPDGNLITVTTEYLSVLRRSQDGTL